MKNQVRWLFAIVGILGGYTYAQTTLSPDSCSEKRLEAENHFNQPGLALSMIRECIEKGDTYALLLGGKLLLEDNPSGANKRKAFTWTKKAAEAGNVLASCQLGIFYKDGMGTSQNYDKAMQWFSRAYEKGNSKGSYSIGYLYMKGLGVEQSYTKAIEWFEKSNYPMATHFLGLLHYFGYGVPANKAKGLELLKGNPILNSQTLYGELLSKDKPEASTGRNVVAQTSSTVPTSYTEVAGIYQDKREGTLLEQWSGELISYDCSGDHVAQRIPVGLTLYTNDTRTLEMEWRLQGKRVLMPVEKLANGFLFDNATLPIERTYRESPYEKALNFMLLELSFGNNDSSKKVEASLTASIAEWNEPAPRMELILNSIPSEEAKEETTQKEEFITLYPNPFRESLQISYELEKEETVRIDLYDLSGTYHRPLQQSIRQRKGQQKLNVSGKGLKPGMYIVRITTPTRSYTQQLIKH